MRWLLLVVLSAGCSTAPERYVPAPAMELYEQCDNRSLIYIERVRNA